MTGHKTGPVGGYSATYKQLSYRYAVLCPAQGSNKDDRVILTSNPVAALHNISNEPIM